MSVVTDIRQELEDVRTAKFIAGALRDISATKMRIIREGFRSNIAFFNEISALYELLKLHAARRKYDKKRGTIATEAPTKIAVAITSNKRFYGTLNNEVMTEFLEHMKEQNQDCMVIGSTGKQLLVNTPYKKRCRTLLFENDSPTVDEMRDFLEMVRAYEQVLIFYPKFVNVFKQEVAYIDITHTPDPGHVAEKKFDGYIFEPELLEMLEFFERHIRYILFHRTMLETELSRTAARLLKMNTAEHRATDRMEEKELELRKEMASLSSMRLLETFAGFATWKEK